ncbi:MAG: hypothetical protein HeimC2_31330 [Candidatus Heimdallarchaeota archaeon LC_2]|nr:MAG: hypothetical protein HeimC2_31330 [Candidatus Heimdallarchaeota archaeon LC_2]
MIQGLDEALNFADSIVTIYIILMILPYILRWVLNWIMAVLAFIFRLGHDSYHDQKTGRRRLPRKNNSYYRIKKIRSFTALITLPGTLLRVGIMFLFLRLRGWSLGIKYPGFVGKTDRSLLSDRRTGFTFSMSPDKRRRMTFKDIALISIISYLPLYLTYLMWINKADNLDFIIYIQQGNLSEFWINVWYYYLLFALFVGGAPIPEETMVPIYYLLGEYPHLFAGIILAYIMGFLLSLMELGDFGFEGKRLGYIYFLLFSAVLIFRILLNQKHMGNLTKSGLDDLLLEMDVIELI